MTIFVIKLHIMTNFGNLLRDTRQQNNVRVQDVADRTCLDQSVISRYEHGTRIPPEKHLPLLAEAYKINMEQLRLEWVTARLLSIIEDDPQGLEALQVAESRAEYLSNHRGYKVSNPSEQVSFKLATLEKLKVKWQDAHPLDTSQYNRMKEWLRTSYTFESNRIEGNTLTLHETEMVIHQGLTIGGKSVRDHLEAINHAAAVDFILDIVQMREDINPKVLRELHSLILNGIDPKNAGRYRQVPVRISGSTHVPPQPWELDHLMDQYFTFYERQKSTLHPVLLAAEMHERLVTIHPFIDGNGRTSRLVMNLILLRNGYTIVNLRGDTTSRLKYYQALEAVQADNKPELFHELIIDHAIMSLNEHLEWV